MCMFIVLISPSAEFSRLHNLHPWYRNSLLYGLISSGENSAHFLQLMTYHNAISHFTILHFSFHQVPITAGWTEAVWYERFYPTPLHTSNFSDLRELVTLPCATICVRQTASLYQQVFHCHSGSVVSSTGRHQTATPYMPLVSRGANSGPQPWESGA